MSSDPDRNNLASLSKVQFFEARTGISLTIKGEYKTSEEGPYFREFNDVKSAVSFAKKQVLNNPSIECSVEDSAGTVVHVERDDKIAKF